MDASRCATVCPMFRRSLTGLGELDILANLKSSFADSGNAATSNASISAGNLHVSFFSSGTVTFFFRSRRVAFEHKTVDNACDDRTGQRREPEQPELHDG